MNKTLRSVDGAARHCPNCAWLKAQPGRDELLSLLRADW